MNEKSHVPANFKTILDETHINEAGKIRLKILHYGFVGCAHFDYLFDLSIEQTRIFTDKSQSQLWIIFFLLFLCVGDFKALENFQIVGKN